MDQSLNFTVDSALLKELGEKLVQTVHLALAELIKNSYDADAELVTLKFIKNENGEDEIHIVDNGVGMNFEELEKYWMRIATTNKSKEFRSPGFGRFKTGAKGIGRFCVRRLGDKLRLITSGTNIENGITEIQKSDVTFEWGLFEAGTDVTKIKCPGQQSVHNNLDTGTTLIISGIKEKFDKRGYNWLKRQLAVLSANRGTRRKGYQDDSGFNILLEAPEFEGEGKIVDFREELLNAGWGTITAYIDETNRAVCELDAMGIGKTSITSQQRFPNLNDIHLKIGILVEAKDQIRDKSVLAKLKIRDILTDWGGVQVRYHGFRVYPYGNDDWLKIDYDRGLRKRIPDAEELLKYAHTLKHITPERALLSMLSMRSYVGNVEIGPMATGFEMKSNREGFIDAKEFTQLKEFVRFAVDWSTIQRDYHKRIEDLKKAEEAYKRFKEKSGKKTKKDDITESAAYYIKEEITSIISSLPVPERKRVEEKLDIALDVIVTQDKSTRKELTHQRLIAATSTLLLVFAHEVKSLLGRLDTAQDSLKIIEEELPVIHKLQIKAIREDLYDFKERFKELLEMTALFSTNIGTQRKTLQLVLKERIDRSVSIFKLVISTYNIDVNCEQIPRNIVVKGMLEAELYAVLLNVLSNSIKSVIAGGIKRKIDISAVRDDGKTILKINDTGIRLSSDHFEEVFTSFLSDPAGELYSNLGRMLNPEDKHIVGTGSGLGLSIIKEILKDKKGDIYFNLPHDEWNNELEIILP